MNDLAAYERRSRRAGLPLFIADYTASEDTIATLRRLDELTEDMGDTFRARADYLAARG